MNVAENDELLAETLELVATYNAYQTVRRQFFKRPSPIMLALEAEMGALFSPLLNTKGRILENKACAIFDYMVASNEPLAGLHPGIVEVKKEMRLPCGHADRVLYHEDGTITAVEIKARGSRRDHVCGLGQALMYATALREITKSPDVRSVLFVAGESDPWVAGACASAGVGYINVSSAEESAINMYANAMKSIRIGAK